MKKPLTLTKAKTYPFLGFRPTPHMERQLRAIALKRGVKISAVVRECVTQQLEAVK